MGRAPDTSGRAHWLNQLNNSVSRRAVLNQVLQSNEFKGICAMFGVPVGQLVMTENADKNAQITMFVHRLYAIFLDRNPERAGLNYWTGTLLEGATGRNVARGFVFSTEFRNKQLSDEEFVKYMYRGMLGREAEAAGFNFWVNQMARYATQAEARAAVFEGFAHSSEFRGICERFGVKAT